MFTARAFSHVNTSKTSSNMSAPPAAVVAKTQEWESKLKGKNVSSDDVALPVRPPSCSAADREQVKQQLPEKHRVIRPGTIVTRDFVEDRLNVHVDEAGECTHCTHG